VRAAGVLARPPAGAASPAATPRRRPPPPPHGRWDAIALITSFKAVVLEGLEVVFIVIAVGAVGGNLIPAAAGAGLALLLVLLLGLALHRPLARVPENGLKFAVGVLLSAFGAFWVGEGLGFAWPGEDLAILGLMAGLLCTALLSVAACRLALAPPRPDHS